MLTPRFEIAQTDAEVTIIIHAPYANIKQTDVYAEGTDFIFSSTPYYLRLKLPGEIEENNSSSGSYDCNTGDFTLCFSKINKGEHFENLDMITTLLAPSKKKSGTLVPTIEVIGNPSADSTDIDKSLNDNNAVNDPDPDDKWFVPQNYPPENINFVDSPKYGFANKISGALTAFEAAWIKGVIDLPMPDRTPKEKRKSLREECELNDFNEEYYMADLMMPECIEPAIAYLPEWDKLQKNEVAFSDVEVDLLKELPNKEYLLEVEDIRKLYLNLVDILYANCYNHRTTLGENTVESCWTINKLSSTLCWFEDFTSMDDVITACFRRSLCYPLFRNWELSMKVFEDVKKVVKLGKKYIIKRLCEVHSLFNNSYEPRYLLNQLYINDFLIWLQFSSESSLESLQPLLDDIHPNKANMGLDLVELETAAYSVQEEGLVIENVVHEITDQFDGCCLNDAEKEEPKNAYQVKQKQFFKCLLSSSSSSTDSSDTDSETDSESSTTSSSTSNSSDLDSDDSTKPV